MWLELVKRDEDTSELIKSSIKEWFACDNDDLANAFVYWRYIYEKQDGSININFLRGFRI